MFYTLSADNGRHMVAQLFENDTMFSVMTCTGPVEPAFEVVGPTRPGDALVLPYDQDTGAYGDWPVTVVRVNRKTVTVRSDATGGQYKIEVVL